MNGLRTIGGGLRRCRTIIDLRTIWCGLVWRGAIWLRLNRLWAALLRLIHLWPIRLGLRCLWAALLWLIRLLPDLCAVVGFGPRCQSNWWRRARSGGQVTNCVRCNRPHVVVGSNRQRECRLRGLIVIDRGKLRAIGAGSVLHLDLRSHGLRMRFAQSR